MKTKAFTLIELLVVIAIIALLSSVVLASLNTAREKGRIAAARQFAAQVEHAAGEQAVGIWEFDECSGSSTADRSGFGYNGALIGTSAWAAGDTPSGTGCALSFNGSTDYVDFSGSALQNLTDGTVSMWFKPNSLPAPFSYIIGATATLNDEFAARVYPDGSMWQSVNNGCDGGGTGIGAGSFSTGKWNNVVITWNSAGKKLYLNGNLKGTYAQACVASPGVRNNTFGTGWDGSRFPGLIDAPRIFAKELTASEVGKLYAEGAAQHLASNE